MRLIDADEFINEARGRVDMQEFYLPIHIKQLVIDEMPTICGNGRLIDADKLINDLCENYVFIGFPDLLADFGAAIKAQPTIDAVPVKHGYWLWNDYGGIGNYHCSECLTICNACYDYCPYCGARMKDE